MKLNTFTPTSVEETGVKVLSFLSSEGKFRYEIPKGERQSSGKDVYFTGWFSMEPSTHLNFYHHPITRVLSLSSPRRSLKKEEKVFWESVTRRVPCQSFSLTSYRQWGEISACQLFASSCEAFFIAVFWILSLFAKTSERLERYIINWENCRRSCLISLRNEGNQSLGGEVGWLSETAEKQQTYYHFSRRRRWNTRGIQQAQDWWHNKQ